MGQHMSTCIAAWGPPSQVFKNEEGGVLVYDQDESAPAPSYKAADASGKTNPYPFRSYERAASAAAYDPSRVGGTGTSRLFWVNAEGYIYLWARKGS